MKDEISREIENVEPDTQKQPQIKSSVLRRFKNLDYCRSLHAEENAILNVARVGGSLALKRRPDSFTYPEGYADARHGVIGWGDELFLDVYFHKTRRIMDIHLTEFLRSLLPGEKYPKNLKTFLKWDDNRVMEFIRKSKDRPHTGRLLKRQHYRVVSETTDHPQPEEIERFDWLKSELEKNYDPEILRFDEARKNPYNFTHPPIFVFWRKKYHPLHKRSPLANNLRKIQKMRIYTRPDFREVVEDFCNTFLNKREQRR